MRADYPNRITKPIQEILDTSGFAFPKPSPREKSQPKDGRLIERGKQYSNTKHSIWLSQDKRCVRIIQDRTCKQVCGRYMPTPAHGHRHHPGGRGLGGGKRNDLKTEIWCWQCHTEEHEQLRKGRPYGSSSGGKGVLSDSSEMESQG